MTRNAAIIARLGEVVLRPAQNADLENVDRITIVCYAAIVENYVSMLGPSCFERVRNDPELTWEERKTRQNRSLFEEHPEWVWVLEDGGGVFGFVTFRVFAEQGFGHIENNGVLPERAGMGWGKFMYRHVLQYLREQGIRFAHVETGLDAPHAAARRAYEGVGFDRQVPSVEYWQDLAMLNPGSVPGDSDRPGPVPTDAS